MMYLFVCLFVLFGYQECNVKVCKVGQLVFVVFPSSAFSAAGMIALYYDSNTQYTCI